MSVMIDSSMNSEYDGCQIINIRRGKGPRADIIYAQLVDKIVRLRSRIEVLEFEIDCQKWRVEEQQ